MRCSVKIKKGVMTEVRRCFRDAGHAGSHAPDLVGMYFGALIVVRRGKDGIRPDGRKKTRWIVKDKFLNIENAVDARTLIIGQNKGVFLKGAKRPKRGSPECNTVRNHLRCILNENYWAHKYYHDMPLFDEWNPEITPGGALRASLWIFNNLGLRPSKNWSLDIINHAKGFVPGNLRWAKRLTQISNQRHRLLGQLPDDEFAVEAKRRGYIRL